MSVGSLLSVHRVHVPQLVTGLHHCTYVIVRFVNYPCMHCPYSGSYPQDTFNPLKGPNSLASTQNIKSSQLRNISEYCINVTITHEIGPESSNGEGGGVSGHNGETGMTCPPVLPRIRGGRRYSGIGSEQSGATARRVPAPFLSLHGVALEEAKNSAPERCAVARLHSELILWWLCPHHILLN